MTPRRALLAAALPPFAIRTCSAGAAEFEFATGQSPANPINTWLQEATAGRLEMRLFPNDQSASDTDQISQSRAGGIEFLNVAGSVLSTLVPATALVNVGFAFSGHDQVWRGVDGVLRAYISGQVDKAGITLVAPLGGNGFRQIATADAQVGGPVDLKGLHIRMPVSPTFTFLFQVLGAAPTSINLNEVYTVLQTRLVGGQENGLVTIGTAKPYEVQKYCSETSHIWDCFCVLANRRALARLPVNMQNAVTSELRQAILDQRADEARLDAGLKATLQGKDMTFTLAGKDVFRAALQPSSFYADQRARFGDQAWAAPQSVSGDLA